MSISTKRALGIAAVIFAGAACTEVVTQQPGTYPSKASQSTQPPPAADAGAGAGAGAGQPSQPAQQAVISDVSDSELTRFFSSMPDGRGLPAGSGTVAQGEKIYTARCSGCHGAKLEGGIGDKLIGGRGSLAAGAGPPVKTLESYWPYATTLFDYIKRAMPFDSPGSLSADEVYAVAAYILNQAQIVPADATMNKETLPKVEMPNRNGFRPSDR